MLAPFWEVSSVIVVSISHSTAISCVGVSRGKLEAPFLIAQVNFDGLSLFILGGS